jgi:hypothetical protein
MGASLTFVPRLASNHVPPYLCFLSRWYKSVSYHAQPWHQIFYQGVVDAKRQRNSDFKLLTGNNFKSRVLRLAKLSAKHYFKIKTLNKKKTQEVYLSQTLSGEKKSLQGKERIVFKGNI